MKKKIYVIFLLLGLMITLPFAVKAAGKSDSDAILNAYKQHFRTSISFYQKMYACIPYSQLMEGDIKYQIVGKENGKCHVKMGSYNCHFPMDAAKQYASTNENYLKKKLNDISTGKGLYLSTDEKESQYFNNMNNKYCKIEWSY